MDGTFWLLIGLLAVQLIAMAWAILWHGDE